MDKLEPAAWQRLNRLLDQALALAAPERAAWIDALDPEAAPLAPLLRLLLLDEDATVTHALPGALLRARLAQAPQSEGAGDRIGPYRLIHLLGEGGMSRVWLAERADGVMQRRVALKMPLAQWADRGLAERIRRECAVLASLNHPNIAQLYDAGWSEAGRPYLALELVHGAPIDEACRARGLDVRGRVRLFLDVLRAVAYAHARLVVHRDLKPANVLLTEQGQVKLLDFGIAKVLEGEATAADATELTHRAGRPLTLAYAAPEQILGAPVTTAADIFSLGAMLHELLSDRRLYPKREDRRTFDDSGLVRRESVPLPSRVASRGARALRGDLDTIVLKALAYEPEARYETAAAFADDLERYLDGRAVRARRASRWYRAGRFVARNRVVTALAGTTALALTAGLAVALWQAHLAARDRDRALAAMEQRDAVDGFLADMLQDASRSGKPLSVAALIARADAISQREFTALPEARASVLRTVGEFKLETEGAESALPYFDKARELLAESPDEGLRASVNCSRAVLLGVAGHDADARATLLQVAESPQTPPYFATECLHDLAQLQIYQGDAAAAGATAQRALARWGVSAQRSPAQQVDLRLLAATAMAGGGRPREADREFAWVQAELKRLGRDRGSRAYLVWYDRIEAASQGGDVRHATEYVEAAGRMFRADLPDQPLPLLLAFDRSVLRFDTGRYAEALAGFRELEREAAARDPAMRKRAQFYAAIVQARLGRQAEAERDLALARHDALRSLEGWGNAARVLELHAMAQVDVGAGRYARARASLTQALAVPGSSDETLALLHRERAEVELAVAEFAAAAQDATIAVELSEHLRGDLPASLWVGQARLLLARALRGQGRGDAARENFALAAEQLQQCLGPDHPWTQAAAHPSPTAAYARG